MPTRFLSPSSRHQRGVGSLAVTSILLLVASLVVLYLNRSLIFEQRTSANQMRAASAHEVAEAGLEWAIGMFNHGHPITDTCTDDTMPSTNTSFRTRYVAFPSDGGGPITQIDAPTYPNSTARPGCSINPASNALTCSCPASGAAALTLGTNGAPHFTVRFEPEKDNADSTNSSMFHWETVRITAIGCTATNSVCIPPGPDPDDGAVTGNADATAIASVAVKLRPNMAGGSFAALTCGGNCNLSGNFKVANTSLAANGLIINAGSNITGYDPKVIQTIPGLPIEDALIKNDPTLKATRESDATCSSSALFQNYFGSTIEQYRDAPTTKIIDCTSANNCGPQVNTAYTEGARAFYFPNGFNFNSSSSFTNNMFGTLAEPVIIVTPADFRINAQITINGVIFSNNMEEDSTGTGGSTINGSLIACGEFVSNGNGIVNYSDAVMANMRRSASYLVKVPGSWRDWSSSL